MQTNATSLESENNTVCTAKLLQYKRKELRNRKQIGENRALMKMFEIRTNDKLI